MFIKLFTNCNYHANKCDQCIISLQSDHKSQSAKEFLQSRSTIASEPFFSVVFFSAMLTKLKTSPKPSAGMHCIVAVNHTRAMGKPIKLIISNYSVERKESAARNRMINAIALENILFLGCCFFFCVHIFAFALALIE